MNRTTKHEPLPPTYAHETCSDPRCTCPCITCAPPAFLGTALGNLPPTISAWIRPQPPTLLERIRLTIGETTVAPNAVASLALVCRKAVTKIHRLYVALPHPDHGFLTSVKIAGRTLLERRDVGLSCRRFLEGEHEKEEDPIGPYEQLASGGAVEVAVRNTFKDHQAVHVYAIATELTR